MIYVTHDQVEAMTLADASSSSRTATFRRRQVSRIEERLQNAGVPPDIQEQKWSQSGMQSQ